MFDCQNHPGVDAAWLCPSCDGYLCDDCMTIRQSDRAAVETCKGCGDIVTAVARGITATEFAPSQSLSGASTPTRQGSRTPILLDGTLLGRLWNMLTFILRHPLNRQRPLSSLGRLIGWQVRSRLARTPIVHSWVNGSRFMVEQGMTGLTGNIYAGLHEFEEMAFVLHLLRPGDLFVDIGANAGSYTVLAGAAVGAHCVSIEPVPAVFQVLQRNVDLNDAQDRVACLNIGLGSAPGTLRFTATLDTVNHVVTNRDNGAPAVDVRVEVLDEILRDREPILIKLDVEGYETAVIEGASETLERESLAAVVMETNGLGARYGFDDERLHQRMLDRGFQAFAYEPFSRELRSLEEGCGAAQNTLYVRDAPRVRQRLQTAPRFQIQGSTL